MKGWAKAYKQKRFEITTKKPSRVAEWMVPFLPPHSHVLDLGCGNGRNSIFFADKGFRVDAVDLVDLGFAKNLSPHLRQCIRFVQGSALGQYYLPEYYRGVLMTRLIQYLPNRDLEELFSRVCKAMREGGVLALNYNAKCSEVNSRMAGVPVFSHDVEKLKALLARNGLKILNLERGARVTTHVPYKVPAETYDILAIKQS